MNWEQESWFDKPATSELSPEDQERLGRFKAIWTPHTRKQWFPVPFDGRELQQPNRKVLLADPSKLRFDRPDPLNPETSSEIGDPSSA